MEAQPTYGRSSNSPASHPGLYGCPSSQQWKTGAGRQLERAQATPHVHPRHFMHRRAASVMGGWGSFHVPAVMECEPCWHTSAGRTLTINLPSTRLYGSVLVSTSVSNNAIASHFDPGRDSDDHLYLTSRRQHYQARQMPLCLLAQHLITGLHRTPHPTSLNRCAVTLIT